MVMSNSFISTGYKSINIITKDTMPVIIVHVYHSKKPTPVLKRNPKPPSSPQD